MPQPIPAGHPLRRLFTALTEQTFIDSLGVGDPKLTDYLADLLTRFVHVDSIWKLRSARGKQLTEVAEMMAEAELEGRSVGSTREIHRHIGDFTLFWTGAYPEALHQLRASLTKDHLIDFPEQGKRSYWIASQYDDEPYREEAAVLRRLSEHFELFAYGLGQIRREWQKATPDASARPSDGLIS
jgi:chlorite dismutase